MGRGDVPLLDGAGGRRGGKGEEGGEWACGIALCNITPYIMYFLMRQILKRNLDHDISALLVPQSSLSAI